MRVYEKILVSAVVALPLVAAFVGAPFVRPDTSDLNRTPATFPDIAAGDLLDADEYASISAWLRDRVPLRRQVRYVDTKIDREIFGEINTGNVLLGRDGWLFFEPAIGLALQPGYDPDDLRAGITRLKRQIEAAGKRFLFVVAPDKPTIYPQFLRERDLRRQTEVDARLEQFRDVMRREPVGGFIDVWDEMAAAAGLASEPIYFPRDTHWTTQGSLVAADMILDRLAPERPGEPDLSASLAVKRVRPRDFIPDLVKNAGFDHSEVIQIPDFERTGIRWKATGATKTGRTRTVGFAARTADEAAAPLLPRIAVICDSYGNALHRSLRLFFKTTTFLHTGSLDTKLARKALEDADIVLFLRAERFIWAMSEDMPFAEDSKEVLRLLSTLRRQAALAPRHGLTEGARAASGNAAVAPQAFMSPDRLSTNPVW